MSGDGFDVDLDARHDFDHRIPANRRERQVAGTWMAVEPFERREALPVPLPGVSTGPPAARVVAVVNRTFGKQIVLERRPNRSELGRRRTL